MRALVFLCICLWVSVVGCVFVCVWLCPGGWCLELIKSSGFSMGTFLVFGCVYACVCIGGGGVFGS